MENRMEWQDRLQNSQSNRQGFSNPPLSRDSEDEPLSHAVNSDHLSRYPRRHVNPEVVWRSGYALTDNQDTLTEQSLGLDSCMTKKEAIPYIGNADHDYRGRSANERQCKTLNLPSRRKHSIDKLAPGFTGVNVWEPDTDDDTCNQNPDKILARIYGRVASPNRQHVSIAPTATEKRGQSGISNNSIPTPKSITQESIRPNRSNTYSSKSPFLLANCLQPESLILDIHSHNFVSVPTKHQTFNGVIHFPQREIISGFGVNTLVVPNTNIIVPRRPKDDGLIKVCKGVTAFAWNYLFRKIEPLVVAGKVIIGDKSLLDLGGSILRRWGLALLPGADLLCDVDTIVDWFLPFADEWLDYNEISDAGNNIIYGFSNSPEKQYEWLIGLSEVTSRAGRINDSGFMLENGVYVPACYAVRSEEILVSTAENSESLLSSMSDRTILGTSSTRSGIDYRATQDVRLKAKLQLEETSPVSKDYLFKDLPDTYSNVVTQPMEHLNHNLDINQIVNQQGSIDANEQPSSDAIRQMLGTSTKRFGVDYRHRQDVQLNAQPQLDKTPTIDKNYLLNDIPDASMNVLPQSIKPLYINPGGTSKWTSIKQPSEYLNNNLDVNQIMNRLGPIDANEQPSSDAIRQILGKQGLTQ